MASKIRLTGVLLLLLAATAWAVNIRLYFKDGTWQMVREYKVQTDRIRFYSIEQGDWEEIPVELVDLKRTEEEAKKIEEERKQEAIVSDAEEKAEREARHEVDHVPVENGAYWVNGDEIKALKQAESKVVNNKRRNVLKVLSPVPLVTGKSTVELDGEKSAFVVTTSERPEFYFRLVNEERFGIIRLNPQKGGTRLVEKVTLIPVSKEMVEERDEVEIFRRQVADGLYKIWPTKPMEPGEYAIIEFTDGKVNMQVWDFSYRPTHP